METWGYRQPTPAWMSEVGLEETAPRGHLVLFRGPSTPRRAAGLDGSSEVVWFVLLRVSQAASLLIVVPGQTSLIKPCTHSCRNGFLTFTAHLSRQLGV